MKICLLTLVILLFAGKLPGEELQIACFNHFTSFFREFQRPGDMILSIRKMTEEEIGKQLEDKLHCEQAVRLVFHRRDCAGASAGKMQTADTGRSSD